MVMEENTLFTINKKYDSLAGRYVREIKTTDIFSINAKKQQVAANGTLGFVAFDANTEGYITGFAIHAMSTANAMVYVTVGNSTILPVQFTTQANQTAGYSYMATRDAPLYKVAASSTVSIATDTAGTYSAWLSGVREPIITKVETA